MLNSIDTSIFYLFNNLAGKSKIGDWVIVFFANYLAYLLILALALFIWKYAKSKKQFTISMVISALISRFVVTEVIRFLYERPRPFVAMHVTQLIPEKGGSFPSGHASFFFAIAMILYLYNKKWGIGFFIASILMGLGRVAAGVHYPLDILGGAIIGMLVSYITFKLLKIYLK